MFRYGWLLCALAVLSVCGMLPNCWAQATDLAGHAAQPISEKPGEVSVLFFLREDCPISSRYAPAIQRLSRQFGNEAVRFWLVFPSKMESSESIAKYVGEYGYQIPALRDPAHSLVKRSQAEITPESAVFVAGQLVYHGRIDNQFVDFGKTRSEATVHDLSDVLTAIKAGKRLAKSNEPGVGCYISDLE
jgi:AhpC/TSA family